MASDAASQPSPAASVASSATPNLTSLPSHKRTAPVDGPSPSAASPDAEDPGGAQADSAKKRRTGPGSRGVANLTPAQLAKKRANDREAQRAIRERTKNQIENLEKKIQELTSQQPYQDLQAAVRAKEAVEAENADIKRRLASMMSLIQPLLTSPPGPPPPEQTYSSPTAQGYAPAQHANPPVSVHTSSTPGSAHSPGSVDHHPNWHVDSADQQARGKMLNQQRHNLRHNLDLGPEKLGLDFLLDPNRNFPKIQNGLNGAQDTAQFHHVPMKHDWTGVAPVARSPAETSSNGSRQPRRLGLEHTGENPYGQRPPLAPSGYMTTELKNCGPTCPLDSLLLDFLHERRQRAADGLPTQEIIGPRYPSVSSLLNPANSKYSHPLSKVFTDILSTFPDLSKLPERVAVLYVMFLIMRWQIAPSKENLDRLPSWAVPVPEQFSCEHPAWIDHLPFPLMRSYLAREHLSPDYMFDMFFVPFTATLSLNWPYEETDTLLVVPDSNDVMINPVFERHMRRLENWTLGDAFAQTFPGLEGTYNYKSCRPRERR
ncbi:hypothetical protein BN1708_006780 [Verticillium longisporum]|uniref:BZIP domain-containing protein n=2 Tax=Verticillium longisporum TaxID=100787 RepID=A0A0G4MNI7_VERLO|nr:hypothetical protein BN1708_006780 [Verticillium longisporum]